MKYNRTELGNGIGFSEIIDEKFKTSSLTIRFITPLDRSSASGNDFAVGLIAMTNKKYKTLAELSRKRYSLYGAGLSGNAGKRGDLQILNFQSTWLNNRYAIDGEDIRSEMLDIVRCCLFEPNVENGAFDAESFNIARKEQLDSIDAEINNKRGYAIQRATELAFENEPAALNSYGTKETAEAVTPESAYKAYLELLRTARVEIYYVSAEADPYVSNMLSENFAKIDREPVEIVYNSKSPIRSAPKDMTETFDVRQCKMVMNFKTDSDDFEALKMINLIFGATPVSKLFANVREKMSLCYYCASRFNSPKNAIMVDCGIERANIEKTKNAIIAQLDEIRNGNISDDELQSALLTFDSVLTQVGDTPSSYKDWFFERGCDGKIVSPEEYLMAFKNVTKDRMINAAKSIVLDSVYVMLDKEEK